MSDKPTTKKPVTKATKKPTSKTVKLSNGQEVTIRPEEMHLSYMELEVTQFNRKTGQKESKPHGQFFEERALQNFLSNGRSGFDVRALHVSEAGKKAIDAVVKELEAEQKRMAKTETDRIKNEGAIKRMQKEIDLVNALK